MISFEKSKEGAIVVHGKYTSVVPKRGRKKKNTMYLEKFISARKSSKFELVQDPV